MNKIYVVYNKKFNLFHIQVLGTSDSTQTH